MLTSKQRATLRSYATSLEPIFQVGKEEISQNQIKGIDEALLKRELIKINVLRTSTLNAKEVAIVLSDKLKAETVAVTGNKIVLYRRSRVEGIKHIEFK